MAERFTVSGVSEEGFRSRSAYVRARRRSAGRERLPRERIRIGASVVNYQPVQQILQDILRSACDVLCASQAFIVVARNRTLLEVAGSHEIHPDEVMHAVLSQAALPVHTALREKIMTAGDLQGCVLPMREGAGEERTPAVLCVPLDLGSQLSGVLCLLRRSQPRRLSDLDLEIVQALAEQAALAIGAASHSNALSRLHDSLSSFTPAYA